MRPSFSSNPNAPHRATTPVLIDFFAKEAAEQQERTATIGRQSPVAELNPRGTSLRHRPDFTTDAGPSADSPVTVSSLRNFLRSKGHPVGQHIYEETIQSRLNAANLSAETLLTALEITHTPDHPLLRTLAVSKSECQKVINRLKRIVNHSSGFTPEIIGAAQGSNNNPDQLIRNCLQLVR